MKNVLFVAVILFSISLKAQLYATKTGHIHFYSLTKLEDIEANNYQVSSQFDAKSGKIGFVVLIRSFEFKNRTMQEHFNDTYLESEKYPKATFLGTIVNANKYDFTKPGTYKVEVEGKMTIKGITNSIKAPGTIIVKSKDDVSANSEFMLTLSDYKIDVSAASKKVADEIKLTTKLNYKPKK